jgi:hypothetical protein
MNKPNDVNAENKAFGCVPEVLAGNHAAAGRKGGHAKAANARNRAAKVSALKAQLESLADTAAKQALALMAVADYEWLLALEICHRSGKRLAGSWRRHSEKRINHVRGRITNILWRLGAMPRLTKAPPVRYLRREDAPSKAAWLAEIKRRQWENGDY